MSVLPLPRFKFYPLRLLVKHSLGYFTNMHFIESINAKSQLGTIFIPHLTKVGDYVCEMTTSSKQCARQMLRPLLTFQTKVLHLINL